MVKMAELHAEGITNLVDYQLGREHKLLEVQELLRRIILNANTDTVSGRMALQVLLATLMEDTDEQA